MNAEVKKMWVEALRSGEYKQGRGQLRFGNEYCCLGVLCDLHSEAVGGSWVKPEPDILWLGSSYDGEESVLPTSVVEWAGLNKTNPVVCILGIDINLIDINDVYMSFSEIANCIEALL